MVANGGVAISMRLVNLCDRACRLCLPQNGDTALDVAVRLQKHDVAAQLRAATGMLPFARADPSALPPVETASLLIGSESIISVDAALSHPLPARPPSVDAARLPAPSNRPAPKGVVWVAAACGDLAGLENELAKGGSTEEVDEVRNFEAKRNYEGTHRSCSHSFPPSQFGLTAASVAAGAGKLEALKLLATAGASLCHTSVRIYSWWLRFLPANRIQLVVSSLSTGWFIHAAAPRSRRWKRRRRQVPLNFPTSGPQRCGVAGTSNAHA